MKEKMNIKAERGLDGKISYVISRYADSENDIFFQNDVDLIKIKEVDGIWYYMHLGLFLIKIPIEYIDNVFSIVDDKTWEHLEYEIVKYMLNDYYDSDEGFRTYISDNNYSITDIRQNTDSEDVFSKSFCDMFYDTVEYFDNCAVIKTDASNSKIERILLRPKNEKHVETISWE